MAASLLRDSGACGALFSEVCGCRERRGSGRRLARRTNDWAGVAPRRCVTLCAGGREWAFRTGEASAVATKSKQGTATANAVVTFLIRDGTTGIKFTRTGQPAQW